MTTTVGASRTAVTNTPPSSVPEIDATQAHTSPAESIDSFERAATPAFSTTGGAAGPDEAAQETYARYGDRPFDLTDPKMRELLVAASPQIDNNPATTNDERRCGGASVLNAMILSGDTTTSANAIEAVAKERGMAVDGAFGGALASMRSGTLTPNQAAVLQEGMFELGKDMSRDLPPEYSQHAQSEGGLSPMEVSELSGQLAAKGAFGDAQSVHFTLADVGPNNHWVAAVTHADGSVTGSDPSPNAKGTAPTFSADTPIVPGHENYVGDVTLTPQGGGQTHYELRLATDHGVQSIEKTTAGAPRVWE